MRYYPVGVNGILGGGQRLGFGGPRTFSGRRFLRTVTLSSAESRRRPGPEARESEESLHRASLLSRISRSEIEDSEGQNPRLSDVLQDHPSLFHKANYSNVSAEPKPINIEIQLITSESESTVVTSEQLKAVTKQQLQRVETAIRQVAEKKEVVKQKLRDLKKMWTECEHGEKVASESKANYVLNIDKLDKGKYGDDCSICGDTPGVEENKDMISRVACCGQHFCKECLEPWRGKKKAGDPCPLCKGNITKAGIWHAPKKLWDILYEKEYREGDRVQVPAHLAARMGGGSGRQVLVSSGTELFNCSMLLTVNLLALSYNKHVIDSDLSWLPFLN